MRQRCLALCLLASIAVPGSYASPAAQTKPLQTATIVSVRKYEAKEPPYYGGDNPSDAPLQAEIHVYDVSIRTGCNTYVARYQSAYDYLPSALAANYRVPVRVGKHDIAFDLGDRQMQLPIAHSNEDRTANCQ
jgi:hypothetical protein